MEPWRDPQSLNRLSVRPHEPAGDSASAYARAFGRTRRDDPQLLHRNRSSVTLARRKPAPLPPSSALDVSLIGSFPSTSSFRLPREIHALPLRETFDRSQASYETTTTPVRTIRGSGLATSLSRPQSVGSPLFRPSGSLGVTHTHSRTVTPLDLRREDAANLRSCDPRPQTPEEHYDSARQYLQSRGIGVLNRPAQRYPWAQHPPKVLAGCSGIMGI